jgi:small nuclear ribonucleoprotein (snRNP)-like protein
MARFYLNQWSFFYFCRPLFIFMLSDPSDLLKAYLNENVLIKLKSSEYLEGVLIGFDEYHSLLLSTPFETKFIRGENVLFIGQK